MIYGEEFEINLSCPFNLANYPFDSHECLLYFGDPNTNSSQLKFNHTSISYMDKTNDGFDPITLVSPLPFEFQLKALESKEKDVAGYHNVSYTGMCLHIKRKSFGLLLSGYYYPTTSFALFSMVSFIIDPDVVSQIFKSSSYLLSSLKVAIG